MDRIYGSSKLGTNEIKLYLKGVFNLFMTLWEIYEIYIYILNMVSKLYIVCNNDSNILYDIYMIMDIICDVLNMII